jgi:retron-type reverse transcriptase
VDTDHQTEEAWVLGVQRKLYQQSKAHPDEAWRDLWGWLTDLRMIRHSWRRVASNKGKRSAGIDGITVKHIQQRVGEECFLEGLRTELRSGAYRPSPARRKLIPKAGKPGRISRPKSHKHSSPRLCEAGSFLAWSTSGLTLGKVRGTRTLYRRTRF